jgi:hypothetical protein
MLRDGHRLQLPDPCYSGDAGYQDAADVAPISGKTLIQA